MNLIFMSELEWMLAEVGAVKTDLEENPRKAVNDVLSSTLKTSNYVNDDSDDDDWHSLPIMLMLWFNVLYYLCL